MIGRFLDLDLWLRCVGFGLVGRRRDAEPLRIGPDIPRLGVRSVVWTKSDGRRARLAWSQDASGE